MKFKSNFKHFHWRKQVWKCLRNVVHFVSVSMCLLIVAQCSQMASVSWVINDSDKGLSLDLHQVITWTNDELLFIRPSWKKNQRHLNKNIRIFIQGNELKNPILSQVRWVNAVLEIVVCDPWVTRYYWYWPDGNDSPQSPPLRSPSTIRMWWSVLYTISLKYKQ